MISNPLSSHPGFAQVFKPDRMTLGFMMPLARLDGGMPNMAGQLELASLVDDLGFAAVWARDVPFFDLGFGDAGQIYDPWIWLGMLAARTTRIALATAGIVLPLRHPFHTAKAAFTLDTVSGGRFILGGASGDRPAEFPAFGTDFTARGGIYRHAIGAIRGVAARYPSLSGPFGELKGLDMLPKPSRGTLPMVAIGSAQQTVEWIAENMDGWMTYPRDAVDQRKRMALWKSAVERKAPGSFKPFGQPLLIDLLDNPAAAPTPIPLGFRSGRNALVRHLDALAELGVNHVALQLRFQQRPIRETIEELAVEVLPRYPTQTAIGSQPDAHLEDELDEALAQTFPASDPVSITPSYSISTAKQR